MDTYLVSFIFTTDTPFRTEMDAEFWKGSAPNLWQLGTHKKAKAHCPRYVILALSRISPRVRVRVSAVSIVYRIAIGDYSWIWPSFFHQHHDFVNFDPQKMKTHTNVRGMDIIKIRFLLKNHHVAQQMPWA